MKVWVQIKKDYINYLKIERGLSQSSVENYAFDLKKLIQFLKENNIKVTPTLVSDSQLQEFLYQTAKIQSARSQARLISGLKSFFNYLIFEGYREDNPMQLISIPKTPERLPEVLSLKEINLLIEAVDRSHPQGERNYVIIETLYSCGLRVSELINLRISDLFFNEGFIRVEGKGSKQRLMPISDFLIAVINEYRTGSRAKLTIKPDNEDILFLNRNGRQLTRAMIFTITKNLGKKTNLKKKISPHIFRHSFATHLLENGADIRAIQQMLGHENIVTTEIYMHVNQSYLREVIEKFHPRK